MLIADCFAALDDPGLVRDYVSRAKDCFEKYWDALKDSWDVYMQGEQGYWELYGIPALRERKELSKCISAL